MSEQVAVNVITSDIKERVKAGDGGLSFFEGMRLLAGIGPGAEIVPDQPEAAQKWAGISAGRDLEALLRELREPKPGPDAAPPGLHGELRPYQKSGVHWMFSYQAGPGRVPS
jgi:hypothetical protein